MRRRPRVTLAGRPAGARRGEDRWRTLPVRPRAGYPYADTHVRPAIADSAHPAVRDAFTVNGQFYTGRLA